ncbi:MAG: outer membrane beta-barrel protein [Proteobacteria bacterium]|nr:outer membrane beta-barrel protein [Pseudomonadota bacterium]
MDFSPTIIIKRSSLLVTLCGFLLPGVAVAQQYYDPGLLQITIDRKPADFQSGGIRVGGFALRTGVEIALEHNDNIFYLENEEISDSIIHVRPWASLRSDWSRHELNISVFADIGRYDDFGSEDYEDWVLNLDGRIDVKRGSSFNYKASYMQLHEDRSSPDDVGGIAPTQFIYSGFGVGYSHSFNRLTAALDFETIDTDYDNNINGDGDILDNQDRDRTRNALTFKLGYEFSPQSSVFISAEANEVDYDQEFDNNGFARSSDGYRLRGGFSWDMTGVLTGDLYGVYLDQEYDDPRFNNIDGFGIGADLVWMPTELTNINVRFVNSPGETTQIDTSGYFSTLYSVRLQHQFRRNLLAHVRFSYTDNDYEYTGSGTAALNDNEVIRAGLGLSYLFNRHVFISGGYVYEDQNANTPIFDYTTKRWYLTLGLDL